MDPVSRPVDGVESTGSGTNGRDSEGPWDATAQAAPLRRGLFGLAGLGALSQSLIQFQAYRSNPVVRVPSSDAAVIWERAGEIAGGQWLDSMPLETAPLPLWLAAFVRWLGGGLAAFGCVQSVLYVCSAILIALVGKELAGLWVRSERSGERGSGGLQPRVVGLLAGALFLLLDEPAAGTSRVLAGTSQLFLGAAVLWLVLSGGAVPSLRRCAVLGPAMGLLCLSYPPLLAAIPLLGIWLWRGAGLKCSAVGAGLAVLAIAPATIHNYRAVGEFIPISSQAGLTFYHGNNPSADGVIAPMGVVSEKRAQAAESLAIARAALGADAGWADADRYWRRKGLSWWAESPGQATGVAFKKLWYGLSGRRYGDIHQPWRERDDGTATRLWLAPMPLAWILPVALLTLVAALGRRTLWGQWAPAVLLFVVPLAVCVVFFYTPRYRLPAAVVALPLGALALCRAAGGGRPAVAAAVGLGIGVLAGPFNRAIGFDVDSTGAFAERHFQSMAASSGKLGDHAAGARYLGDLLRLRPSDVAVRLQLAQLNFVLLGNGGRALEVLSGAPPELAMDVDLALMRGHIQTAGRTVDVLDPEAALATADSMVAAMGPGPEFLDLRAKALARLGRYEEAVVASETALSTLTLEHPARTGMLERLGLYRQGKPFTEALPVPAQ